MLEVKNLSVKYNSADNWAIRDISFTANKGKITLVTGASGSGKSTLAGAIMTIIPNFIPAEVEGTVYGNKAQLNQITRSEFIKMCGYIPQYPADFVTTLSVEEEITNVLENLGKTPEEISIRVNELFSLLEIEHLRKKVQTEISSGELQRVALAVAIAPNPSILILDEPMARIDLKSERMLVNLISKLAKQGMTVLAFEHRLDYLLEKVNQVILLEDGMIKTSGSPQKIIKYLREVDIPEVSLIETCKEKKIPLSFSSAVDMLESFFLKEETKS